MRTLSLVPVLLLLAVPSGAAAATRFAAPAGTGTACTQAARCSLPTAFDGAATGDTVSVGEGAYALTDRGLNTGARGLTVLGEVTGPRRPTITLGGQVVIGTGSRLIDLGLDFGESGGSLVAQGGTRGIGDRLLVRSSASTPCLVDSTDAVGLSNSVCATDTEGIGVSLIGASTGVRGVTALGRGFFGSAASVLGGTQALLEDTAMSGGDANGGELFVGTRGGVAASVTTRTSAYQRTVGASPVSELGRVAAQPVFRDATLRDLRQAAVSPTVDAGSTTQAGRDLNGNLRTLGVRTDIGAYEQVPAAPVVAPPTAVPARRSASVTASLTLAGGAADAVVELLRVGDPVGAAPVRSAPVRVLADSATGSQSATVAVAGLEPDTAYTARFSVTTDAGTATSAPVDVRTLPEPTAATDAPADLAPTTATAVGSVRTTTSAGTARFRLTRAGGDPVLTPSRPVPAGTTSPLREALTGLAPATTYGLVLEVTTDEGTFASGPRSFTTPATTLADTGSTTTGPTSAGPGTTTSPAPGTTTTTPGVGGVAPAPSPLSLALTRSGRKALARVAVARSGAVVRVGCGRAACTVRLAGILRAGTRRVGTLGSARTTVGAQATRSVRLKATKALKAALRRKRTLVLTVTASATTTDGRRATRTLKITVR